MPNLKEIIVTLNNSYTEPVSILLDTNIFMKSCMKSLSQEIISIAKNSDLKCNIGTLCEVIAELYNLRIYGDISYKERYYRLPDNDIPTTIVQKNADLGLKYYGYLNAHQVVSIFNTRFIKDEIQPNTFADSEILAYTMRRRADSKPTIIITNDLKLTYDILNYTNNLTSTKGNDIIACYLTDEGEVTQSTLSRVKMRLSRLNDRITRRKKYD
ncbi:MAG: hypothetical protein ACI4WH_01630 [Oscillospiraceae bacterium]